MLEHMRATILSDAKEAEEKGFVPASLASLYLLTEVLNRLDTKPQVTETRYITEDTHTGMMVAFFLSPRAAKDLAIPGGEPASVLHITLGYLGDMNDDLKYDLLRPDTSPFQIKQALTRLAAQAKPLHGKVGGFGRFTPSVSSDGTSPIIALVDVPGLTEFRTALIHTLQSAGYFVDMSHGYTAHITLGYIDADAPMPISSVPDVILTLDTMYLCVGDARLAFKLGDPANRLESTAEAADLPQPAQDTGTWQQSDASTLQLIDKWIAEGYVRITWGKNPSPCAECLRNEDVTVEIGTPFPTGAYCPPQHDHCACPYILHKADGTKLTVNSDD